MSIFVILYLMKLMANSETTPDVEALTLNGSNPDILPQFVEEAHLNVSFGLELIGFWNSTNSTKLCCI